MSNIPKIKTIKDIKKTFKLMWGAISSFQSQLYHIVGDINEIQTLIGDINAGVVALSKLTIEIKKLRDGEKNEVSIMIDEFNRYKKEAKKE